MKELAYWLPNGLDSMKKKQASLDDKKTIDKKLNHLLLKNSLLEELATQDFLTKIPNRLYFHKALKEHVERAVSIDDQFALLLIDVDHFKAINDTYGHDVGDEFLKQVASRIQENLRKEDIFVRFGGDEFAVIVENIKRRCDVEIIAEKLIELFNEPFYLEQLDLSATVSIGISIFSGNDIDDKLLLKHADLALYLSKKNGRNQYQLYHSKFDREQKLNLKLESLLHNIDKDKEFSIIYQPIIDFISGKIIGLESLLRWKNNEIGYVSPEKFIPLAEKTGKMNVITAWVIERIGFQLAEWMADCEETVPVTINLSSRDLRNKDLIDLFKNVIQKYDLTSECFQVDVSESTIMNTHKVVLENISGLQKLGIFINIDDFGAGYSSLFRLRDLPIRAVKIDRAFLSALDQKENHADLIAAIISFSKHMQFRVIAEGVETKAQFDLLKKSGCDFGQGHYFLKPMPLQKIKSYFKSKDFSLYENTVVYS